MGEGFGRSECDSHTGRFKWKSGKMCCILLLGFKILLFYIFVSLFIYLFV